MPEYVTVEGVELMSTGMAWRGMTGRYYVTAEHLADIVAAQADPLIRSPRVKLGHTDLFFGALAGTHDPGAVDGEPGFGTVVNLRVDDGGAKLLGDLVEVPDWLASAMASAYPTRSAEWIWDHQTAGGRRYSAVLTDIALGSWRPAVEDLADVTREQATAALRALLENGPEAAEAALQEDNAMPAAAASGPAASVSVDRIAAVFDTEWAYNNDLPVDTSWWWVRDVRVDPDEVIASDGEGGTWRVPYTTDGEYGVTFGEPVEVRQTYVDLTPAAASAAAGARAEQRVLVADRPRPQNKTRTPAQASAEPNPEENLMDDTVREVLERQGVNPAEATEEQIQAASTLAAAVPAPTVETETVSTDVTRAEVTDPPPAVAPAPEVPTGAVLIDAAQLEELRAAASQATSAVDELHRRDDLSARREYLDRKQADGTIHPSARGTYELLWDKAGSAAAREQIDRMQPGLVPVLQRGEHTGSAAAASDHTTTGWFPQLKED